MEWHTVVARRTFCFCWMNPLVGLVGRWHETVAKRKFSVEIVGSIARNVRFGSFVLGNLNEASHETFVLEACSVKFRRSLARNVRFGSFVL